MAVISLPTFSFLRSKLLNLSLYHLLIHKSNHHLMRQRWEYVLLDWAKCDFWERSRIDSAKDVQGATLCLQWKRLNLATGDFWHIMLSWRRHQQCFIEGTVSIQLLLWQLSVLSPHHPNLSRGSCISHSGIFCNKYPSKSGFFVFSSASFQLFYITVSWRAPYFKAL